MRHLFIIFSMFSFIAFSGCASADKSSDVSAENSESRQVLNYKGWVALKRQKLDAGAKDDEWVSMRDVVFTDDGQKVRIMDGDKTTPYSLELIVITYEETNTTVLKLALYEEGKDKAISYIWGEPETVRLGMNLRWMQVGVTKGE